MGAKVYTGTLVFDETNAAAQIMKTIALTKRTKISSIWIDGINATRQVTASLWVKIDAANSRQVQDYDSIMPIGEAINLLMTGAIEETTEVVIKLQCDGLGAGNVNILYSIPYDDSIENVQSVFNGTGHTDDVDLKMRSLKVDNDTGDAVEFKSSGGNGDGLAIIGHGTGKGIDIDPGATGNGITISGGLTGGQAINISTVDGDAIAISAGGATKQAIDIASDGNGIRITTIDGAGIKIVSGGANGIGIDIDSNLQGMRIISDNDAMAIDIQGHGGGSGIKITAGSSSHAIELIGGSNSGDGINIITTDGSGIDIALGAGAGAGKHGIKIATNSANNDGINIDSDRYGMYMTAANKVIYIAGQGNQDAIHIEGTGGKRGMYITNAGTLAAVEFAVTAGNGIAFKTLGSGTGHGIHSLSGSGATGDGIKAESQATNGNGINGIGTGTENGMKLTSSATGKGMEINQQTKSGSEDIFELMHSRLGGKHTFGNTGGGSEIQAKLYDYSEAILRKTLSVLKPDLTDNDGTMDVGAMAGQEQ